MILNMRIFLLSFLTLVFLVNCTDVTPQVSMLSSGVDRAKIENDYLAISGKSLPADRDIIMKDPQGNNYDLSFSHSSEGYRYYAAKQPGLIIKLGMLYSISVPGAFAQNAIPVIFEGTGAGSSLPAGGAEGQILQIVSGGAKWVSMSVPNHSHAISDISGLSAGLASKADSSSVPTKISQLTNDVGFLSSVSWSDVSGKPVIPDAQVNADWNAVSGAAKILNKPVLGSFASKNSLSPSDLPVASASQAGAVDTADQEFRGKKTFDSVVIKGVIKNDIPPPIAGNNVDLSLGNTFILTNVGGSTIALSNMTHGGSHTLVVQDPNSRIYNFSGCDSSKFLPTNSNTIENSHSIYAILTIFNGVNFDCYITWATGYY